MEDKKVCIIGLGYVGLPLAEAFSSHLKTIAFDIDEAKVKRLSESNNEEEKHRIHRRPGTDKTSGFCFDMRSHASNEI